IRDFHVTGVQTCALPISYPLKAMSSAVIGAGVGWFTTFVNRHVPKSYDCRDSKREMEQYLRAKGFSPSETVGMMTAAQLTDGVKIGRASCRERVWGSVVG